MDANERAAERWGLAPQTEERLRVGRELVDAWRIRAFRLRIEEEALRGIDRHRALSAAVTAQVWEDEADRLEAELRELELEDGPADFKCGGVVASVTIDPDTAPSRVDSGRGTLRRSLARLLFAGAVWRVW